MRVGMAPTSWRATTLGAVLTAAMTVAAWAWWEAALSNGYAVWSAGGALPVVDGTTARVQLAVAVVWTIVTGSVAMGTAAVLPVAPLAFRSPGPSCPLRRRVLASRIAAALLAITLSGPAAPPSAAAAAVAAPAAAAAAPVMSAAPSDPAAVDEDAHPTEPSDIDEDKIPVPGWVPAPPPTTPAADVTLVARGAPEDHLVTVRRGETLWSIAADHLSSSPTLEQVAESWPRWYAANREVIGADPHLILPGQQLRAPSAALEGVAP